MPKKLGHQFRNVPTATDWLKYAFQLIYQNKGLSSIVITNYRSRGGNVYEPVCCISNGFVQEFNITLGDSILIIHNGFV